MKHKMRKLRRQAQDAWERQELERERSLGDFTTTYRVIPLSLAAVAIGIATAYIAWALLRLIGLFTNLFYFGRWSTNFVSPAQNHLGAMGGAGARCRIAHHRTHGSLRVGAHSRPRHSGSD